MERFPASHLMSHP
jgi:two-component system, OmpR family, response regulator ChvI